jgi:1,4-dihydroxy-2-naphthoate octaprenyltransferase
MQHPESTLKKWLIAIRPFALPASTMPVIFGSVLAAVMEGVPFHVGHFLLALLAMVILHSAANMLNDVIDYRMQIDKVPTPVSGAIVRQLLSSNAVLQVAVLFFFIGCAIGLYLAWIVGPTLFVIGFVGVLIGIFYTLGPVSFKYHALGDLVVFLNFGILGSLGAWLVQTGHFSWLPAIWAIPMSLFVIAILHANNWRDTASDSGSGIKTVASVLGDHSSLLYYGILIFSPFLILIGLMIFPRIGVISLPPMPLTFLITIFSLPLALKLWHKAEARAHPRDPLDFIALDGATAQINLVFGLLCTSALLLHLLAGKL